MVYGICRPGFLHCSCQTVNPGKQICINLVKLIHKLHLRSLLIVEKGTFNVLLAQLIEFQTQIQVSEQVRGNIETHGTRFAREITSSNQ